MTTHAAGPVPPQETREVGARETLQRTAAIACTLPPDTLPRCVGQIHMGIFFDGTGNNLQADYVAPPIEKRKHSNIVRLFHAHRSNSRAGFFASYIPGVGTRFQDIGDDGMYWGPNRGSAFAARGEDRINWAFIELLNAVHRYVYSNASLIQQELAATIVANLSGITSPSMQRRLVLRTWQDKLKSALVNTKPRITQINLSVFGFSRGAAQARAFVNWLFEVCEEAGGGWRFAGIPIRVHFLGLFDTVASVGLANLLENGVVSGHQSWADGNLQIHPAVEQCIHFIAGHEVRACFPLDSVRTGGRYPDNAREIMYPGSHSDVGGGYRCGELGVTEFSHSFISMIAGQRMYHEALKAGVALKAWNQLAKAHQEDLTPNEATIAAFNAYVSASRHGSGPVEALHKKHWQQYLAWRLKHHEDYARRLPAAAATPTDRPHMLKTQTDFILRLRRLQLDSAPGKPEADIHAAVSRYVDMRRAAGLPLGRADQELVDLLFTGAPQGLAPEVERLFEHYVHDSMAGFMKEPVDEFAYNGLGIGKLRTIYKGDD